MADTSGDLLPDTAIEANLSGSGAGSTWVVNNSEAVSSEKMTMTGAPQRPLYGYYRRYPEFRLFLDLAERRLQLRLGVPDLCVRIGSGALGLTQASGAWLEALGTSFTSEAAFMGNLSRL